MIILAAAITGMIMGALTARRRGGKAADIAQYAAGYGIAFALAGVMITLFIHRAAI